MNTSPRTNIVPGRNGNDEKTGPLQVPITRRGVFAALACAAGLALLGPARKAEALAGMNFNLGQGWFGAANDSMLVHLDPRQGEGDMYFGFANSYHGWLAAAPANTSYYINHYGQWLRYAFACVFECNYANELYTLVVVRPFAWCSSKDLQKGRGLWTDTISEGGDNKGYVYLDGAEVAGSRFAGDLRNQIGYRYYDWISYGFYDFNDFQESTYWGSTRPSFWVKRQKGEARHSVWSKLQVYNVHYNQFGRNENWISEKDAPNYWFLSQTTPSRNFRVEKIYIRNDATLYGGIFYIRPVSAPDIQLDLVQGQYSGGKPLAQYGNGASVGLWEDYRGVNQTWMLKPYTNDGVDTFTFAIANMVGPNLTHMLNNSGHAAPVVDHGVVQNSHADIWDINDSDGRSKAWWVHHEPDDSNETDHSCYFITSDADGLRLDTDGVTSNSGVSVSVQSAACPGRWAIQKNAQWNLVEARIEGKVSVHCDEGMLKIGDKAKICGWHNTDPDDPDAGIKPAGWVLGCKNESDLPVRPIFRLYMSDVADDLPEDDAAIFAQCGVATWGWQQESLAHRHIGYPHGGHSIYGLALRLEGSAFPGSIHYAAQRYSGGEWVEGADGARILDSESDILGRVKVWLTGEIADHYDLEIRTKLLNGSGEWSDPVYVNCSASSPLDINTAPAAGIEPDGADGNKICGMNIHLVRKPQGGRVVREFSKSEDLTVDASWGPGYLSVAAMLGIRTVGKTERYVWTDRYLGTLVSRGVPVVTTCVEYYADGVEQKDMVYRDLDVEGGDVYTPVDIATQKALKDTCNLNGQYGQNPSTGFSGWFLDPELTQPAAGVTIIKDQTLKLYGRNRCTVRIEYAEGSLRPEDGGIYRTAPLAYKPDARSSFELPDFSQSPEKHRLDGLALAAIGDDGQGHKALYWGESVTPVKPGEVFAMIADETWRRYVPECWMTSADGTEKVSSVTAKRDVTLYIKWTEAKAEGVASSKG